MKVMWPGWDSKRATDYAVESHIAWKLSLTTLTKKKKKKKNEKFNNKKIKLLHSLPYYVYHILTLSIGASMS